ncbi:MAG: YkgJ family cysteine cluster protein [Nitrospirae bacterium]|nr:YkgJ family cysteine cluster protein [Nitrospirota bacterium]
MQLWFDKQDRQYAWLSMLLESYSIVDSGIEAAIQVEKGRNKRQLACHKGCGNCCRSQTDIPVYPHEIASIYWYVNEKIPSETRSLFTKQIDDLRDSGYCPFLTDEQCSIHFVRPASCRVFNVFGRPCQENEDPFYTRRYDVLIPPIDYINEAFYTVLPFYGIKDRYDRIDAMEEGFINSMIINLKTYDWKGLFSE